ncbi:trypsin-like serine protease [Hyalangium versicolor]|uniref:trypsin-like serine protease n=1 Tax=Hyalangium versicolor TaxID=2861190 RepID=UPI001CCD7531|nr:trypsin-like serine protease [Hyalangium versicolor]
MPVPLEEKRDGGWETVELELGPVIDQPLVTHLLPLAGEVDETNRYLSAVLVKAQFDGKPEGFCSGAIIGRRIILTSGHCVCQRRKVPTSSSEAQDIIDGAACAKTATVSTTKYGPFEDTKEKVAWRRTSYQGSVRPHPGMRVILDAQGQVVSSHADLAVIVLAASVEKEFRPIPLADKDVQLNESIVIVGTGYDEEARAYDGERRSSINKVIEVLPSQGGRMRIQQPGNHHYRGDSGGPCLRESPKGTVLVGVSSRNLGEGEAIMSTYPYQDWLRGEVQRAEKQNFTHPP